MEKIDRWMELVYENRVQDEYDQITPIVADEGKGKSTFMLESTGRWQHLKGDEPSIDSVLDRVVWDDRAEFRTALADYPRRAAIPVMDAAHVLFNREQMNPEQIEAEKGLLDVRTQEYFILLGYQDWDDIPRTLRKRRAKNVLRIPTRGTIYGYSRASLDEKYKNCGEDEWPEPDLIDTFPNLDGTDLWAEFKRRDREHKKARLRVDDDDSEEAELTARELAEEIRAEGVGRVVSIHGGNKQPYIDAGLIEADYGVSIREAKKVKSLLEREVDVEQYA
ncbi:hypothetical protein EI982_14570 [Haloplanus rallus]|uniref:Uncharacterized protein n=1 Tax=Haloplanus rallus TaxID=1816183 RepID=A0A6B9FBV0_9EURY|nr:hypothetical protein [Haloplanus rallus]QGX95921.1 hypothetical protein EI982_14570 [Haloplanus rallus]